MASPSFIPSRAGKYVTFQLGRRYYAVPAPKVRNVMAAKDITPVEHSLDCLRGVVQVNGRLAPVVDLHTRLHLARTAPGGRASVIVLQLHNSFGLPAMGILVDRVSEVVDYRDRDIHGDVAQLRRCGKPYGRPKTILDVDRLFTAEEIRHLRSAH